MILISKGVTKLTFILFIATFTHNSVALTSEQQSWVDSHNTYRRTHQVPDVAWSEEVARSAQAFANTCPNSHSNSGYGENLAWASWSQQPSNVTKRWYTEVSKYDYNQPGFSMQTGHFTQIVWKSTTHIGCAINNQCRMSVAVCQYSPPGNFRGRYESNVFPPKTNTPKTFNVDVRKPENGLIKCDKVRDVPENSTVTCEAKPDQGFELIKWGDACVNSGSHTRCQFSISSNAKVSATMKQSQHVPTQPYVFYSGFEAESKSQTNIKPLAYAGEDKTVNVNEPVQLTCEGVDKDGSIIAYQWNTGEETSTITVTPRQTTTYSCKVKDNHNVWSVTDDITITVSPTNSPSACQTNSPNPTVKLTDVEQVYTYGMLWLRFNIDVDGAAVSNNTSVTKDDISSCETNDLSRTRIEVYDANKQFANAFCTELAPKDLAKEKVTVPKKFIPFDGLYLKVIDRKCGIAYKSDKITL